MWVISMKYHPISYKLPTFCYKLLINPRNPEISERCIDSHFFMKSSIFCGFSTILGQILLEIHDLWPKWAINLSKSARNATKSLDFCEISEILKALASVKIAQNQRFCGNFGLIFPEMS